MWKFLLEKYWKVNVYMTQPNNKKVMAIMYLLDITRLTGHFLKAETMYYWGWILLGPMTTILNICIAL